VHITLRIYRKLLLYNNQYIVAEIRSRRIVCLRMDLGQMVKQLFDGKLGERRRTGRPRLRWLDDVEADLRTMGIKRCRLIAKDRTEWAGIIREKKALQGP
jgi:hypothetical protein